MPLTATLKSTAKALRRVHCFAAVSKAVSCLSLFFLVLSMLNMAVPLAETTCAVLGWAAIVIAILYIIKDLQTSGKRLSIHSLAMDVEKAHPELMDSFICAVELEAKDEPLRPMEADLVADVHNRVQSTSILKDTFHERLRLAKPLAWGLAAVVFTVGAIHTPAIHKWFHANRNAFSFAKTTESEYPRHSDVPITVSPNRWEQDMWIDVIDGDGGSQRYPMHRSEEDGASSFVFYDVQNTVRYRVGSPSLKSKWFSFNIFDPPEITSLTITVTPPAYTGKPAATYTELQDFAVIEGSVIAIDVQSSVEATQAIVTKSEKQTLDIHSFILKETDDLRIVLTDNDGHRKMTPWFRVTVEPDLLPVLEQRQPTGDIKIHSYDSVRLDASASDDFGLHAFGLQFTVNGVQRQAVLFNEHKDGTPHETTWDHNALWDVPAMKLKDGDMLSCFFFVEDNREPNHQTTRGEVFFITVEPDEDDIEADGGNGGDQKRTSVADLIVEAKRLLRLTWDTLSLPPQDRARQTDELQRGLPDLQLEIARRENKLKQELRKMIMDADKTDGEKTEDDGATPSPAEESEDESEFIQTNLPEPFNSLFAAAVKAEDAAARLAKDSFLEESAIPQERALTHLVKIENELLRNAMKSKKSKEGKEGKGEQQKQEKQEKSADNKENSQKQQQASNTKQLEEAAELLRRQIAKQEAINASANAQDASASGLADKQQQLGQDTADLEKTLRPLKEAAEAREAVARAAAEMAHGAEAFRKQDTRTGAVHGGRAHTAQLEALRVMEDAIQAAAANQLRRLGEQARDLSQRQMDAADKSGEFKKQQTPVTQQDAKQARQQQQELKEQAEQLRQSLQETADQLDETYPDIAKELRDSVRNMDERKILAAQQRALNALLYKRFDRAEKEQTDASNLLAALAMELDATAGKMPNMTAQELREALQKLQQQARQTAQNMEGEGQQAGDKMEQLRQQAEQNLQKLGEKLKDNRLNELSQNMSLPFNGESPSEAGQFILRNLQQAAEILAEHLQRLTMEKKRELSRSQLAPPLKYRRLVEDYFKQMSK